MSIPTFAPLISIITVVHNDEIGLLKTKKSILLQKSEDWEWIIIDWLSSDGTLSAVADLTSELRVRVLSEKDSGLYDAMNKGAALAPLASSPSSTRLEAPRQS